MTVAVTGSMAFDYIMSFPGKFAEHILPDQIEILSVSFLVDSMRRERGGCAGNIAYNLAMLDQPVLLMATVGQDAPEYIAALRQQGVDTSGVLQLPREFTASFFVSTDQVNNQIASFYTGWPRPDKLALPTRIIQRSPSPLSLPMIPGRWSNMPGSVKS